MKKALLVLLVTALPGFALASPASVVGGKPMGSAMAHNVGVGWPSLFYEWWNRTGTTMDWALGAEIVYGDWSGHYSDVDIGLGLNVPLRWHLATKSRLDVAFRAVPGVLIAAGGHDRFLFGIKPELGVPMSIALHEKVGLVTGVSLPMAVYFMEHTHAAFVLPIMPRIGVEVMPESWISIWLVVEIGPAILITHDHADVDVGVRGLVGATFW